jgi:putative PIN family toxin of toxin-antitoxin system
MRLRPSGNHAMVSKKLKIILDTNILISFLITRDFEKLDDFILSGKIILLFSEELLDEFISVIQRPKFHKLFLPHDVETLMNFFMDQGLLIDVVSDLNPCRDIKDNFLLNLANDGEADYFISGDKDLLDLDPFGKTRIVTISEFLNLMNKI